MLGCLNDPRIYDLAYWPFFASLPPFVMGIPTLLNQHVFDKIQGLSGQ